VFTQGCDNGDPSAGSVLGCGALGHVQVQPVLQEVAIVLQKLGTKLIFRFAQGSMNQGCGYGSVSVSGLDPDSIGSMDLDPDPGGQK